ncbi:MAG: hypothetical protein GXY48_04615 [Methanomicrobiales archaeon]|nr:hypothetical protein [Methanomicrobiales archaeon]
MDEARFSQVRTKDILSGSQNRVVNLLKETFAQIRKKAELHFYKRAVSRLEQNGFLVSEYMIRLQKKFLISLNMNYELYLIQSNKWCVFSLKGIKKMWMN